jgi:soluble lytic murein transglycosylase-like protein
MRSLMLLSLTLLVTACGHGDGQHGQRAKAAQAEAPPAADAPLPRTSSGLADALSETTRDLEVEIRAWLRGHPGAGARPPEDVTLNALFQQRIYRHIRRHPALASRVIAAMPARRRSQTRDNVAAGRSLLRLAPRKPPKTQPPIHIGTAEPPGRLLGWYRQAERRFGVRWQILAAVNFVESGFNRLRNNSYAGAQGPMQFIPSTWRAYGMGGDIRDPHDAIMGAANYLRASGAPDYRRALYSYNPSPLYVDAIIRYARQMQRRSERFYAYWSWQVFVRTKTGEDKRLTGPGVSASEQDAAVHS